MKKISFLLRYIHYRLKATNQHGIHSPFIFSLYNNVINQKGNYYAFERIEYLRKKLLILKREIDVTDLGTGKSGKRSIGEITSKAAKSKKYGELLFRLVNHFKPDTIVEMGTSLGISTSYLASVSPTITVVTIEGCPHTAKEAGNNFKSLQLKNIEQVVGDFKITLPAVLSQIKKDSRTLFFFDGNHQKEPTLNYFHQCLEIANENSIFIFDDIHWSKEMEDAWEGIKKQPAVTITIDLFFLGLVFFRKEQAKENFTLKMG